MTLSDDEYTIADIELKRAAYAYHKCPTPERLATLQAAVRRWGLAWESWCGCWFLTCRVSQYANLNKGSRLSRGGRAPLPQGLGVGSPTLHYPR